MSAKQYCFNRDIVECKVFFCLSSGVSVTLEYCFNRDIVECKVIHARAVMDLNEVLIET